MRIALDYDGTYTADSELWDSFIENAEKNRHEVWIVTMRYDEKKERLGGRVNRIIYTERRAKKKFCEENGIHFGIWIDDTPERLFRDG